MTKKIMCGQVPIGGGAPISIQSMLNVDTRNIKEAVAQMDRLTDLGCEILRLAIPDMEAANAFSQIKKKARIPLVADIHFDYRLAVAAIENGADKIRINPGNIGDISNIKKVVSAAKERNVPIRVGVNAGSLEKKVLEKHGHTWTALVESAMNNIKILEDLDFENIVVSLKSSDVKVNYDSYMELSKRTEYPLHIGVTEAGTPEKGKFKSAVGIGALLLAGVGDTMRVSLTGEPEEEIIVAKKILQGAGIRKDTIEIISCPTCGRTKINLLQIVEEVEKRLEPYREKTPLKIAIMGCEVNGPGEAKCADLGIAFGSGRGAIFKDGQIIKTVDKEQVIDEFIRLVENEKFIR